jgi:hypothetical protein
MTKRLTAGTEIWHSLIPRDEWQALVIDVTVCPLLALF